MVTEQPGTEAHVQTHARAQEWLAGTIETELLRLTTAGSVDDGKSTLIGRLLYDSKGVYEDQLASIRKATRNLTTGGLDLSLLTDGLRAEREQGITIDVAYRYFSTPRRKFIIADTPGHVQYTRNMATGASTADLTIILIDARLGVLPQSRRHAYIASLLGIPNLVVAINKMDLMEFREDVFTGIRDEFAAFSAVLGVHDIQFIPISALDGDNVVHQSRRTPWYHGPALLEHLEKVPLAGTRVLSGLRFPVQYVIRPDLDFRGFAGQIASGTIRRGNRVMVLPSGRTSRVKSIVTRDGELEEAVAPMSITVCLEDEIDVSRGDMLVDASDPPEIGLRFEATLVWMNAQPLQVSRSYLLKHTTQTVQARVREILHQVDVNTMDRQPAAALSLNEIGVVSLEAHRTLFFDPYRQNRATGSFILIDPASNETVAAGMISRPMHHHHVGPVTSGERQARIGHLPFVIQLRGADLLGAQALERHLFDHGFLVQIVENPLHLAQAVLTGVHAGIVSILFGRAATDPSAIPPDLPDSQRIVIDTAEFGDLGELARTVSERIASQDSGPTLWTGGAGI